MEVNRARNKNNINCGLTCTKYALFLLNVVFVIASVLAISTGLSTAAAFTAYYDMMAYGLDTLTTLWLVVGFMFLIVALFGIFVAFKESTALANIYAITMLVVFIMQIATSIYGFTLVNESKYMVHTQLQTMMRRYSNVFRLEVDWIQSNFLCCGINGPSDWQGYDRFSTPSPYYDRYYDRYGYFDQYRTADGNPTNGTNLMPVSCCEQFSNYVNLTCEHYHNTGCLEPVDQIVSASIMLIGTSGIIFSVLQIMGIILGFVYARIVRRKKTERNIEIWNTDQGISTSVRQRTDYSPIQY